MYGIYTFIYGTKVPAEYLDKVDELEITEEIDILKSEYSGENLPDIYFGIEIAELPDFNNNDVVSTLINFVPSTEQLEQLERDRERVIEELESVKQYYEDETEALELIDTLKEYFSTVELKKDYVYSTS